MIVNKLYNLAGGIHIAFYKLIDILIWNGGVCK